MRSRAGCLSSRFQLLLSGKHFGYELAERSHSNCSSTGETIVDKDEVIFDEKPRPMPVRDRAEDIVDFGRRRNDAGAHGANLTPLVGGLNARFGGATSPPVVSEG